MLINNNLKHCRENLEMTQEELGYVLGVTKGTVANWENGNDSIIHWDLVCKQDEGGEIYFDDVLIRKDGKFVIEELKQLNYE